MSVAVIAFVVTVPVSISMAAIVVVLVVPVVVAIVMAKFFAIFATVEVPLPSAMATPVGVFATDRKRTVIAEARIIGSVNVTAESDRTMEPGTGPKKDSASEPSWAVVAERSAVIRGVIVVAVRTNRLGADVDGDLHLGSDSYG